MQEPVSFGLELGSRPGDAAGTPYLEFNEQLGDRSARRPAVATEADLCGLRKGPDSEVPAPFELLAEQEVASLCLSQGKPERIYEESSACASISRDHADAADEEHFHMRARPGSDSPLLDDTAGRP